MRFITIATRDEIYIIDLQIVAYFKAEDHYTTVCFLNGSKMLVPSGLAKIRDKIFAMDEWADQFLQIGRSLLVNKPQICCIKPTKETLFIHGTNNHTIPIQASKMALKRAMTKFL